MAAGESTDAATSAATLRKPGCFGKYGKAGGAGCNYQNVDLFKIPDNLNIKGKQRRQNTLRLSQIENHSTFATLNADSNKKAIGAGTTGGFKDYATGALSDDLGDIQFQSAMTE